MTDELTVFLRRLADKIDAERRGEAVSFTREESTFRFFIPRVEGAAAHAPLPAVATVSARVPRARGGSVYATFIAWRRDRPAFDLDAAIFTDAFCESALVRNAERSFAVFSAGGRAAVSEADWATALAESRQEAHRLARDSLDEQFTAAEVERVAEVVRDWGFSPKIEPESLPFPLVPPDVDGWMPMRDYPFGGSLHLFVYDGTEAPDPFQIPGVVVAMVQDDAR